MSAFCCRGVARVAVLQRRRACSAGADRGGYSPRRPPGRRLSSDEIWDEAARHYDESELAALVVSIASINVWNRLNAATRQITGDWVSQWVQTPAPAGQVA